jgi:quercetin dioxygenase-like cupin family protein
MAQSPRSAFRFHALALPVVLFALALPGLASAQPAPDGVVAPAFSETIPNVPGKSMIGVVVTYPPGGKTPAHHHAHSAFVTGYVLSGAIRSQVNGGEIKIFHAGESFSEAPGARHDISENASTTEPAKLLAIFIVDTTDGNLTTIDH